VLEDRGAVLVGVLAENDADLPFAQQPCQPLLTVGMQGATKGAR
jgi:hypothetical protein